MTEYDYSPEAYHRYMENQSRVARWVDNTEAHAHQFRSPFGTRSDIGEEDMGEDMERDVGGDHHHRHATHRRHRAPLDSFNEMSAGLSTVGVDAPYSPPLHSSYRAAIPQSYPAGPVTRAPLPGQSPYSNLYPSYIPQPQPLQPQMSGYTSPSPLVSTSGTPPPPIVIQKISKRHSRHHHHHHSSSNSSSRSKSRPRTYIIQPTSAPNNMQYTTVPRSSYPGQYGASANPPQTAPAYISTSGYPPPMTSAPVATSGVISPTPTYGYPTHAVQGGNTIASVPGYVIVSPQGRGVKVLYA